MMKFAPIVALLCLLLFCELPAWADPEARANHLASELQAEGFPKITELTATQEGIVIGAENLRDQVLVIVQPSGSQSAQRVAVRCAISHLERNLSKHDMRLVSRRQVKLTGAQEACLGRYKVNGEDAASLAFSAHKKLVTLLLIGKPQPKVLKRLHVVQYLRPPQDIYPINCLKILN